MNILVIAPHPDDESIGVGGLIMSYPRQCTVIVMTDGGAAIPSVNPKTMKHIRKREFEEAMNYAGIETTSTFQNNAAYLAGWLKALKDDKRLLISAAGKAEQAVRYILGEKEDDDDDEAT